LTLNPPTSLVIHKPKSMFAILFALFWLTAVTAVAADSRSADFFVSPQGNDLWSGKRPDATGSDGPFATVARARAAVLNSSKNHEAFACRFARELIISIRR
jgi:hypothetical protein